MTSLAADLSASSFSYSNVGRNNGTVLDSLPNQPGGTGIDDLMSGLSGEIKTYPEKVTHIALNWGTNDMGAGGLVEATWVGQYGQIVAYLHSRFPNGAFYIAYPWRVGFDSESAAMHTWIDEVIANCAGIGATCHAGPDEAVVIKDDDNGFLETDISEGGSGVHYTNPYGVGLYATAMKAALGY